KVICYVVRGNDLLVFRQPRFPEAGLQVPAGTIETCETPEVAALREETGLTDVRLLGKLGTYTCDMSQWKPELHERHIFALEFVGSTPASWSHVERHSNDGGTQGIEFELSWFDLRRGDPDLVA